MYTEKFSEGFEFPKNVKKWIFRNFLQFWLGVPLVKITKTRRVISWLMGVLSSWDDNFGKILRLPWYFCWYIKKFYSKVLTCIYFCKVQVYAVLLSTITLSYSHYSLQTSVLKFKTFLKGHIIFQKFKETSSKICN